MNRRSFLRGVVSLALLNLAFPGCAREGDREAMPAKQEGEIGKLDKPRSEWRKILTPGQYGVMFEEDTERSFTSPLNAEKRAGTYLCTACLLPLFRSEAKFESGTGWPSFYEAIAGHVGMKRDFLLIIPRTEYHCIRCGAHQGHVFDDGPPPTGKRWCNNGLALTFVPEGEPLPELRN